MFKQARINGGALVRPFAPRLDKQARMNIAVNRNTIYTNEGTS